MRGAEFFARERVVLGVVSRASLACCAGGRGIKGGATKQERRGVWQGKPQNENRQPYSVKKPASRLPSSLGIAQ